MDNNKLILIIEDNVTNGTYLSRACKRLCPDWRITWLRPYHKTVNALPQGLIPNEVTYIQNVTSLQQAETIIRENVAANTDLLVFYDLQLGLLQRNSAAAQSSPITSALRQLVNSDGRRVLINIHSADLATRAVAERIDESFERVIYSHTMTGRDVSEIDNVVKETLRGWDGLFVSCN
jgi:hypothetical protein